MRVKKNRLDPETVVLFSDWLTTVARLMSFVFFSLSSPFSDRSEWNWNWFRLGLCQATFLPLVEHPKACGFSVAARSEQEKQQRRDAHSHREALLQTQPVTQKVFT